MSRPARPSRTAAPARSRRAAADAAPAAPAALASIDALGAPDEVLADAQRWASSQLEWWGEQWTRQALAASSWLAALFDAQSNWWRESERLARAGLAPWFGGAALRGVAIEPLFELPADGSPAALADRMRDAWLATGNAWLAAIDTDLQAAAEAR